MKSNSTTSVASGLAAPPCGVIYTRVSTERQAREGISLEAQLAACRRFAELRGWQVLAEVSDEGLGGKLPPAKRPGLAAAIEAVRQSPGAAVIVYSLSRLGRSQRLIWELLDERGEFALQVSSVTEPFDTTTPMGRAFLGMLATFAALESDLASERTSAALAHARSAGRQLGAPDMFRRAPEAVVAVVSLAGEQPRTLRALAAELNRRGVPTAAGGRWHPSTVSKALRAAGRHGLCKSLERSDPPPAL